MTKSFDFYKEKKLKEKMVKIQSLGVLNEDIWKNKVLKHQVIRKKEDCDKEKLLRFLRSGLIRLLYQDIPKIMHYLFHSDHHQYLKITKNSIGKLCENNFEQDKNYNLTKLNLKNKPIRQYYISKEHNKEKNSSDFVFTISLVSFSKKEFDYFYNRFTQFINLNDVLKGKTKVNGILIDENITKIEFNIKAENLSKDEQNIISDEFKIEKFDLKKEKVTIDIDESVKEIIVVKKDGSKEVKYKKKIK